MLDERRITKKEGLFCCCPRDHRPIEYMVLLFAVFILSSCYDIGDRDNPLDPGTDKYVAYGDFSSSVIPASSENHFSSSSQRISSETNFISSSSSTSANLKKFIDNRDGKNYKFVIIGSQTWMAENLNYEMESSYCDKDSRCTKYGRFYTWGAAMKACPDGWHLPTQIEWNTLFSAVGGNSIAGKMLKSVNDWKSGSGNDAFGFSAQPAGNTEMEGYLYNDEGYRAYFWSSTEFGSDHAYRVTFNTFDGSELANYIKSSELNVRCIRD